MGLTLILLTAHLQALAVTIDGDFADWNKVTPVTNAKNSETVGDTPAGINDIETVWMTNDDECLYFSIKCVESIRGGYTFGLFVLIDADLNQNTGYPSGPLGVDYAVQLQSSLDGLLMIHRRMDRENNTVWSRWHTQVNVPGAMAIGKGQQANRLELRIPFKHLGITNPDNAALRIRICDGSNSLNIKQGEWVPDSPSAYFNFGDDPGPVARVNIAHLFSDKPLAQTGQNIRFSAWLESQGHMDTENISITLKTPPGLDAQQPRKVIPKIVPGSYERVDWTLKANKTGRIQIEVAADNTKIPIAYNKASYKFLIIDRNAQFSRQELCTDHEGYWRLLQKPKILQHKNQSPLTKIQHKKSSEIGRNPYGICTHLPRSKDYEDPFNANHLIDDDPETCWSSQQNSSTYPGRPPWVKIDLGKTATITQVNLIPYWRNTDFPLGFSIHTSQDGQNWKTALQIKNHKFINSGEKRADKIAQLFPLPKNIKARHLRIDFERLPLSAGNYAEVSQGYKARLSGIEIINQHQNNVALKKLGAHAEVCDFFAAWQNTAQTVNQSFSRIFDLGLKWVRVGQWGDQTEWAAVEREKGVFKMDPKTDDAIQKLADNRVDILYGMNYGNHHYNHPDTKPNLDIGPIYKEGHPFYLNNGPKNETQRQAFVRYVDFVVRKYKDRVKWWELWNEQNGWYPGHQPELYGKLLHDVAKHIKSIDPDLKVMYGGTAAPAPITTEIALREGAAPYLDYTAFHPYGIDKPEGGMGTMEFHKGKNVSQSREQTGWNRLEEIIQGVKKPFIQHNNPDIQVWINEWGTNVTGLDFTYDPRIGEYGCAKYLMRFYIYAGWLKAPTAWWALYNQNKSQDWGIFDQHDYGFRPMSYALQNVCSIVSDVEPIRTLDYKYEGSAPHPKVIAYQRDNSNQQLVLLWSADTQTDELKTYPSKLRFALKSKPTSVILTDLYWGLKQTAVWSYTNGQVLMDGLIVHDYPMVISCQ